jgi:hypothetical protein
MQTMLNNHGEKILKWFNHYLSEKNVMKQQVYMMQQSHHRNHNY